MNISILSLSNRTADEPERPRFTVQKAVFYKLKGHLLQAERRPFANALILNRLQRGTNRPATRCKRSRQGLKDENKIVLNFELKRIFTIFASRRQDAVRQRQIKKIVFHLPLRSPFTCRYAHLSLSLHNASLHTEKTGDTPPQPPARLMHRRQ